MTDSHRARFENEDEANTPIPLQIDLSPSRTTPHECPTNKDQIEGCGLAAGPRGLSVFVSAISVMKAAFFIVDTALQTST